MSVGLSNQVLESMLRQARSGLPNEVCGLLAGFVDFPNSKVKRLGVRYIPINNALLSPHRYQMETREQFLAIRQAEKHGMQVLAIFHSHPTSVAFPSSIDVQQAFWPGTDELVYPDVIYLILSLQNGKENLRGFILNGSRVNPVIDEVTWRILDEDYSCGTESSGAEPNTVIN